MIGFGGRGDYPDYEGRLVFVTLRDIYVLEIRSMNQELRMLWLYSLEGMRMTVVDPCVGCV